jgi:hypothetical protein
MLLDRRGRGQLGMTFNIGGYMNRFDVFQVAEPGSLANRVIVSNPGVLVADRDSKEFKKPLRSLWSNFGYDCRTWLVPTAAAILRVDQCVDPSAGLC